MKNLGPNSVVYADDSYFQRKTYQACIIIISDTNKLLRELGSVIQTEKSVLTPCQTIVFLGVIISWKILSLNDEKNSRKVAYGKN